MHPFRGRSSKHISVTIFTSLTAASGCLAIISVLLTIVVYNKDEMVSRNNKFNAGKPLERDNDNVRSDLMKEGNDSRNENQAGERTNIHSKSQEKVSSSAVHQHNCTFRDYTSRRYYGLNLNSSTQPDFLRNAEYIRGMPPKILDGMSPARKICIDTTAWDNSTQIGNRRPFSDGTNPSILSLLSASTRFDQDTYEMLSNLFATETSMGRTYLATVTISDGQCMWKESMEERAFYGISPLGKAPSVHTEIVILNEWMDTIGQATIQLMRDGNWGRMAAGKNRTELTTEQLDDARLFVHDGKLWVLYRNGPKFGYEKQILNILHLGTSAYDESTFSSSKVLLSAHVKASESITVCCGRNMATFATEPGNEGGLQELKVLSWIDPVTVVSVTNGVSKQKARKLSSPIIGKITSNIHGTNGFLIPLRSTQEYLGIGHFHRPEHRKESDYARHGHHYTHAFYTISMSSPHHLTRLSDEFVFRSMSTMDIYKTDSDSIQFASGLDLSGTDEEGILILSYGINDCEGSIMKVTMKNVQTMLKPVESVRHEVAHYMKQSIIYDTFR